jgi:site-specific recombinase XerD
MSTTPHQRPKLLDEIRTLLRFKHYSLRTEEAYLGWIKLFILFHRKRHPKEMSAEEVTAFLSHLASHGHVAAATQNQDLTALLFLYKEDLAIDLPWLTEIERARKPKRLPVVLTRDAVDRLISRL